MRVVIVDDEPISRMDFTGIMEDAGYQVVGQCADGFDAVELCRSAHPDIVLMDIRMPVFDGLSAAETIIAEQLAGSVILLTAFADSEFIERAKRIGVSGYLVKPVEERSLIPAIEIAAAQSQRYAAAVAQTEAAQAKLTEKNLVDRAKAIIAKRDHIAESEAYARMQKLCMNKRMPMAELAKLVVNSGENRSLIEQAKKILMRRYDIGESAAFKRIRATAERNHCSAEEIAQKIIEGQTC